MMDAHSFILILFCFAGYLRYGFSNNAEQRISNGIDTNITSVPFILSLRENGLHRCGAVIIDTKWTLTAARCVEKDEKMKSPLEEITLCSGSSILNSNCSNIHKVEKLFTYEQYNTTNDYDIALIKVTPAFTYNDYTKAVDYLKSRKNIYTEWGSMCGWGNCQKCNDTVKQDPSKNLRCAVVPKINKRLCQSYYKDIVTPRMTCYGFLEGGIDACQGDSGGPMVNKDNFLIALIPWRHGCDKNGSNVYIKIGAYRQWVEEIMRENA